MWCYCALGFGRPPNFVDVASSLLKRGVHTASPLFSQPSARNLFAAPLLSYVKIVRPWVCRRDCARNPAGHLSPCVMLRLYL